MILTVTLNTALDKTYQVGELTLGTAHRAEEAHAQAGGKGLNVARALSNAGVAVLATGLAAGSTGLQIERDLEVAGIDTAIQRVEGESRQTVTVISRRGDAWVEIDEQGPELSLASWQSFLDSMDGVLHRSSIVVLSGSLPPGTPVDAYRHLTEMAHGHGAQVVLDAAGPAFQDALAAGPEVVTPNQSELALASGSRCGTLMEVVGACRKLEARGARAVVATLGADGAVATRGAEAWRARHPILPGNPVGAGDALVAGIATSLVDGASLVDTLRVGCAWALASLQSPWAGHVDPRAVAEAASQVVVEPMTNLLAAETEDVR
jgi:tagatose 6-phosphate kinase